MNIFDKFAIKKIDDMIREAFSRKHNVGLLSKYKKEINDEYGIFFLNFIANKSNDEVTVMVKRKTSTYIYSYNYKTDTVILKGERKNVNT